MQAFVIRDLSDTKLSLNELKALRFFLRACHKAGYQAYLTLKVTEEEYLQLQQLIQELARLNKRLYFVHSIFEDELKILVKLMLICENYLQIAYEHKQLSLEFINQWYQYVSILTRNHSRWLHKY